jgi:NAD(P)-dependent dehydrogenase (short-subunit alcohol dehydrogenase family)
MKTTRRAVVTGGGRGIGRAVAAALSRAGHEVTVLGRNEDTLQDAVTKGDAIAWRRVDVSDGDALAASLDDVGPVDILVNNAGVADSAPFAKSDLAFFHRVMSVNFDSVVVAAHAVLPGMTARGFGRVISIASLAGVKGYPYVSAYVASKHAVVGLTRALALEVAKTGVTVNAVCPGYVDTDLVSDSVARIAARTGRLTGDVLQHFTKDNPLGRLIAPAEVADTVVWLCGDGAGAVNGQAIAISGGESAP